MIITGGGGGLDCKVSLILVKENNGKNTRRGRHRTQGERPKVAVTLFRISLASFHACAITALFFLAESRDY